jgi:tetratricopeptide (TPR) repeat protein
MLVISLIAALSIFGPVAAQDATPEPTLSPLDEMIQQGLVQLFNGDYEAAVRTFTEVIALDASRRDAYMDRASAYLQMRNFDAAREDLEYVLTTNPNQNVEANAEGEIGTTYAAQGQFELALEHFNRAIELGERQYYFPRGNTRFFLQDYDGALEDVNQAIAFDSRNGGAYYVRGRIYAAQGNYALAVADFSTAINLARNSLMIYIERANAFAALDEFDLAFEDYNTAISLSPDYAPAYYGRALLYRQQAQYELAIQDFTRAIELPRGMGNYPSAYLNRGIAYRASGKIAPALADFDRALELNPNFAEAYIQRGMAYRAAGDLEQALVEIDRAIEVVPDHPWAYLASGAIHAELGHAQDAASNYWRWLTMLTIQMIDLEAAESDAPLTVALDTGTTYRIPFEGRGGQFLNVTANGPERSRVDPLIVVFDAHGEPLAGDDDSGGGFNATLRNIALPDSGTYTLVVGQAGSRTTGDVEIVLTVSDEPLMVAETCKVQANSGSVSARVGPGSDYDVRLTLQRNEDVGVIGTRIAADGTRWWQVDSVTLIPSSTPEDLWVADAQVTSSGNCDEVRDA